MNSDINYRYYACYSYTGDQITLFRQGGHLPPHSQYHIWGYFRDNYWATKFTWQRITCSSMLRPELREITEKEAEKYMVLKNI